jgi:hypothetical protein
MYIVSSQLIQINKIVLISTKIKWNNQLQPIRYSLELYRIFAKNHVNIALMFDSIGTINQLGNTWFEKNFAGNSEYIFFNGRSTNSKYPINTKKARVFEGKLFW